MTTATVALCLSGPLKGVEVTLVGERRYFYWREGVALHRYRCIPTDDGINLEWEGEVRG